MLTRRIIPCLDVRNGRVVKGVNFEGLRDVDDPVALAASITIPARTSWCFTTSPASAEGRPLFADALRAVAAEVFIPLTVGGSTIPWMILTACSNAGRTKVSVNSGAIRDPSLIARAAKRYGDQCVVLSMDVKRVDGRFHVFACGGRDDTGLDAIDWVRRGVDSGAGEVVVNSIDTDGVRRGFDLEMLRAVGEAVSVPIIASGGAGCREDFLDVFRLDCVDAGLAASIFHSREVDIRALKRWLNENGVPMRLVEDGNDGL